MAREIAFTPIKTSLENLQTKASENGLILGELYYVTDYEVLAQATGISTFKTYEIPTALSELTKDINFDERYYTETEMDTKLNLFTRISGLTSLAIDCSTADIFEVSLSANASFSLTNVPTNKEKKFIITNSGASEITITYPNTADYWESATFKIAAGKKKVTALEFNGTTRFWYLSTEMKNA